MHLLLATALIAAGAAEMTTAAPTHVPSQRRQVAVVEFKAPGLDPIVATNLYELFTSEAGRIPGYKVISQSEIKELLGFEMERQTLGCDDLSCAAEIGGALGVDLLATGSIGKVGDTYVVNLKLIDIRTPETKSRIGETIAGRVELLPPFIRVVAWRLFGEAPPEQLVDALAATRARFEEGNGQPKAQPSAPPVAAPAPAPAVQHAAPPTSHWARTARKLSTAVGVVGILGGLGLHGLSFFVANNVGDGQEAADGGTIYDGSQSEARNAQTWRSWANIAYIVGGVGVVGAVVFGAIEPDGPQVALHVGPSGVALAGRF